MKTLTLAAAGLLTAASAAAEDLKPDIMRWGASAAEMEAALEGKCANGFVNRPIDPPFLPDAQKQVQIDCDGFEFLGSARWTEFVIGDDSLKMVWVMVAADDKDAAVAALTEAYGAPSSVNDDYVAFAQSFAAWRNEPPEVLFYAPELDEAFQAFFAQKE